MWCLFEHQFPDGWTHWLGVLQSSPGLALMPSWHRCRRFQRSVPQGCPHLSCQVHPRSPGCPHFPSAWLQLGGGSHNPLSAPRILYRDSKKKKKNSGRYVYWFTVKGAIVNRRVAEMQGPGGGQAPRQHLCGFTSLGALWLSLSKASYNLISCHLPKVPTFSSRVWSFWWPAPSGHPLGPPSWDTSLNSGVIKRGLLSVAWHSSHPGKFRGF